MFSPRSAAGQKGPPARSSSANASNSRRASSSRNSQSNQAQQTPLLELRSALDRIDALILHAREAYRTEVGTSTSSASSDPSSAAAAGGGGRGMTKRRLPGASSRWGSGGGGGGGGGGSGDGRGAEQQQEGATTPKQGSTRRFGFGASRRSLSNPDAKDGKEKKEEKEEEVLVSTEADEAAIISQFLAEEESKKESLDKSSKEKKQKQKPQLPQNARFMPFHCDDEAELVELLRRAAELVVQGERAASAALSRAEKAGIDANTDDADGDDDENAKIMAEYDAHQAVFECFCEREGLQTIVNLTTGVAFKGAASAADDNKNDGNSNKKKSAASETKEASSPTKFGTISDEDETDDNDNDNDRTVLLPPMSIATQAVQSVSILLQNVVRVTSLYFLLSNNRVNDLINLQFDLYQMAEEEAKQASTGGGGARSGSRRQLHHRQSSALGRDASAETAELTTHFVSFLKSLAMRMNEETLQFFLTYPDHGLGKKSASGASLNGLEEQVNASKLAVDTTAEASGGPSENEKGATKGPITPTAGDETTIRVTPPESDVQEVKFPLYARALQFCSKDQDSFVRVTAMNICLNTLRIATISGDEEEEGGNDDGSNDPTRKSPDGGSLHKSAALPFRERLAIARHVCAPDRVESLVSPIFMKLGHLCGSIGESIRSFDDLDKRQRKCIENLRSLQSGSDVFDDQGKTTVDDILSELEQIETRRQRMGDTFHDLSADLQDELLLLEDLLKVGLTSVNEQTIEMMLATFIYPLLMQPLRLFMQRRHSAPPPVSMGGSEKTCESFAGDGESLEGSPKKPQHPFSTESIANSLERSGLLDNSDSAEQFSVSGAAMKASSPSNSFHAGSTTSADPDSAPAKMALFLASAVFHTITNKPLLHLLLTALFHPLAPVAEGGLTVKATPRVTSIFSNGQIRIRSDSDDTVNYDFGQSDDNGTAADATAGDDDANRTCVFVLAPALSNVFRSTVDADYSAPETRENPYRRATLACLGGTDGMQTLQALAFFTTDAAYSTIEPTVITRIILGAGLKIPTNFVGNYVLETISSLCVGVMTASLSSHDIWNLEFNCVATNALLNAAISDEMAQSTATKLMEHRVRQAMSCLTQLPPRINESMPSTAHGRAGSKASDSSSEPRLDVILDQMFFDPHLPKQNSIVESLARRTTSVSCGGEQFGPCYVPIAQKSTLDDVSSHVCKRPADILGADDILAPIRCGARSAFAHMQLDAFSRFFSNATSRNGTNLSDLYGKMVSVGENNAQEDDDGDDEISYNGCNASHRCIFAPLDEPLSSVLLDEEKDDAGSGRNDSQRPKPGSVVPLVGRAAFPCVCEVSPDSAPLFTDKGACVVAEGIKWQSLYLVILGRYMILAEPEKGGSGGNGRVVSSCRLACLRAEKDEPSVEESQSTARRLLLSYASIDPNSPGIFTPEVVPSGATRNTVRLTRSKMDLWFEDETAAGHAFKVLSARITKARSQRGHKISDVLMDQDSSSPLFQR